MKNLALLAAALGAGFSSFAEPTNSLENFSPHFSTNTEIIWAAPTNLLPKNLWIYKRLPARPFSASVISNAFALASLPDKQIPKPSLEPFYIWAPSLGEGMRRDVLSIRPASTTIYFSPSNQSLSTNDVPDEETVTKRA